MADKNSVKVHIFGSEYQIKGEAEKSYMELLAKMVDQKMRDLAQPGSAPAAKVAILAAFNLADELMKVRQALEEQRKLREESAQLAASLDEQLQSILHAAAPLNVKPLPELVDPDPALNPPTETDPSQEPSQS